MDLMKKLLSKTRLMVIALLAMGLISCTEKRPAKFPDGAGDNIFSISTLKKMRVTGSTGQEADARIYQSRNVFRPQVLSQFQASSVPGALKPLFDELYLETSTGQSLEFNLEVNEKYITVYQVLNEEVAAHIRNKAIVSSHNNSQVYPAFMYRVQSYGKTKRIKNTIDEETSLLRLQETSWENATHLRFSPSVRSRIMVDFPQTIKPQMFGLEQFNGIQFEVTLAESEEMFKESPSFGRLLPVASSSAPEQMKLLLDELYLPGTPGEQIQLKIAFDSSYMTAYKVSSNPENLSSIQQQISIQSEDGKTITPLFKVPVISYGKVAQIKDDQGFKGPTLYLEESSFSEASHVQIPLNKDRRLAVDMPLNTDDAGREILNSRDFDQRIFTVGQFESVSGLNINLDDNARILTRTFSSGLYIFKITTLNDSSITERRRQLLAQGQDQERIRRCTPEEASQSGLNPGNCVVVISHRVPIQPIEVFLPSIQADNDIQSPTLSTRRALNPGAQFLMIIDSSATPEVIRDGLTGDLRNTLIVDQMRNQEFLFRRTLLDSPNRFPLTFPGLNGQLEIVKFYFEEERVVVKRAYALDPHPNNTETDFEELISLPARYYVRRNQNERGEDLWSDEYIESSPQAEGAIAIIDWRQNTIPIVASPLSYFGAGQCLIRQANSTVDDIDMRLPSDGVLNFSLEGTYAVHPYPGCSYQWLTSGLIHYWYPSQANFTFKERISFKKYNGENDVPDIEAIPYEAQRRLGYGIFTFRGKNPNEYNNIGRIGTRPPLQMQHSFRNGKVITYTLAGLPTNDGRLRAGLIEATQSVIEDWNRTLKKAFKDTPLERQGNYLALEVLEDDSAQLGDLDKNFIYWLDKDLRMKVLGMVNPSPNPRSGIFENSDVMVYGGNIRNVLEWEKDRALARKEYNENMKYRETIERLNQLEDIQEQIDEERRERVRQAGERMRAEMEALEARRDGEAGDSQEVAIPWYSDMDFTSFNPTINYVERLDTLPQESRDRNIFQATLSMNRNLLDIRSLEVPNHQVGTEDPKLKRELFLLRTLQNTLEEGALTDEAKIGESLGRELMEYIRTSERLDQNTKQMALFEIQKELFTNEVIKNINSGHTVLETKEIGYSERYIDGNITDLLVSSYRKTLSHELGHAFGLRHNFLGSYDKKNWNFDDENPEEVNRNYTTVMDYISDAHLEYNGPGPYDVQAVRAAYTGLLEVDQSRIADSEQNWNIVNNRFIQISDIKEQLDLEHWEEIETSHIRQIPNKRYMYCSDEDTRRSPICNRHDLGTTPAEIVSNVIDDYHAFYSLTNLPKDRINFQWYQVYRYIYRLYFYFIRIRHFLDETAFRIRSLQTEAQTRSETDLGLRMQFGAIEDEFGSAAILGRDFFHSIIRTPELNPLLDIENRFKEVTIQPQDLPEITYVVERKPSRDQWLQGSLGRLKVRGIEFDQVIAMMMLTTRRIGIPEYDQQLVRFSYPDLEKVISGSAFESDTIQLIISILSERLRPAFLTPQKTLEIVPDATFSASSSELVRIYSVIAAMVMLDTNTIEATDNFSSFFRFGSILGHESERLSGVPMLTQLGANPDSINTLKYWPFDGAIGSYMIHRQAANLRFMIEHENEFRPRFKEYFITHLRKQKAEQEIRAGREEEVYTLDGGATQTELEALDERKEQIRNAINEGLRNFPENTGSREARLFLQEMDKLIQTAVQVVEIQEDDNVPLQEKFEFILAQQNRIKNFIRLNPGIWIAYATLLKDDLGLPRPLKNALSILLSESFMELQYAYLFSNIQFMNMFLYFTHPEYVQ